MKTIKTLLLILFLNFNVFSVQAQLDTACSTILGEVFLNECTTYPLVPYIHSGQIVEECFTFRPTTPTINLSWIILNNTCGPVAPYTWLNFEIYTVNCDTLIQNGSIVPTPYHTYIIDLDTTRYYILCVSWNARCDQFSICPLIYPSPLPIELTQFNGTYNNNDGGIKLFWTTSSEINNDHFEIEKSRDGINFTYLNRIEGAGNSTITVNYFSYDYNPYYPLTYYRLKQIDYDGKFTYSYTILFKLDFRENVIIKPNPTKNYVDIINSSLYDKDVVILINNVFGKAVQEIKVKFVKGDNFVKIDLTNEPEGFYFITYIDDFNIKTCKILKIN